ncbi:hypothetical protein SAICODRAFT_69995 [Saitoella complicata NRRL Y-17804]|nr:uncharacterized protein SAICODRAFT_69995 [Saitoella complicata NRRL Y-17804]ODQ54819.1 hypothetical protein SAICODRAFT_69995 [Saitoella complicata NRRL Y-17804]
MPRDYRALRVHQKASDLLAGKQLKIEPAWYRPILHRPPSTNIVMQKRNPRKIDYPEDNLRAEFYKEHPWELARPRVITENDGRDYDKYDWSMLEQPGKPLDGESVVQHQLWLMRKAGMSKQNAYLQACFQFYKLRARSEVLQRIAREENLHNGCGTIWNKSVLERAYEKEGKVVQDWLEKATARTREGMTRQGTAGGVQAWADELLQEEEAPAAEVAVEGAPAPATAA